LVTFSPDAIEVPTSQCRGAPPAPQFFLAFAAEFSEEVLWLFWQLLKDAEK